MFIEGRLSFKKNSNWTRKQFIQKRQGNGDFEVPTANIGNRSRAGNNTGTKIDIDTNLGLNRNQ